MGPTRTLKVIKRTLKVIKRTIKVIKRTIKFNSAMPAMYDCRTFHKILINTFCRQDILLKLLTVEKYKQSS